MRTLLTTNYRPAPSESMDDEPSTSSPFPSSWFLLHQRRQRQHHSADHFPSPRRWSRSFSPVRGHSNSGRYQGSESARQSYGSLPARPSLLARSSSRNWGCFHSWSRLAKYSLAPHGLRWRDAAADLPMFTGDDCKA